MSTTILSFRPIQQADKIKSRTDGTFYTSPNYQAWVSVASGKSPGLILYSNEWATGAYQGFKYNYTDSGGSGFVGKSWNSGIPTLASPGTPNRPGPIVTSLEVEEGIDNTLTRRANFTIVAHDQKQAEEIISYFLEPGYTVFLQWGWSTPSAGSEMIVPPFYGKDIAKYQNPDNTFTKRQSSEWEYDNYVGMVVGGDISQDGDKWNINVKCNGLSEISMYKDGRSLVYERAGQGIVVGNEIYEQAQIDAANGNIMRFMMAFNELPTARQTKLVKKTLEGVFKIHTQGDYFDMKDTANYINFDTAVLSTLNDKTSFSFMKALGQNYANNQYFTAIGGLYGGTIGIGAAQLVRGPASLYQTISDWVSEKANVNVSGSANIEAGTEIAGYDRYIKFEAAVEILNAIGSDGFELSDGTKLTYRIDIERTVISAFSGIFSTMRENLFIPNKESPNISIRYALENTTPQINFTGNRDNRIKSGVDAQWIEFPSRYSTSYLPADAVRGTANINRGSGEWGFLRNLYINFDLFKSILDKPNISIKDMLYQMLNAMSDAVGALWNFQIGVHPDRRDPTQMVITVEDLNLLHIGVVDQIPEFDISGKNSPFIETSFSMNMSQKMMNKVLSERFGGRTDNTGASTVALPTAPTRSRPTPVPDMIIARLNITPQEASSNQSLGTGNAQEQDEIDRLKAENLARFLGKTGIVPKPELFKNNVELEDDFDKCILITAYDDMALFESYKVGYDRDYLDKKQQVGVLTDINFSFTIHGVSGIRRGDTFKINGSPYGYVMEGFFQVIEVKHTVSGNVWTTEVTGGFRPVGGGI